MLQVNNLHAQAGEKKILNGITLSVNRGEVHAVMRPNGSGKSTLAQVLAGHPAYQVTEGTATYEGQDLLDMEPEERARAGLFLAFQYPVEIPGITNAYFLRAALNEIRKTRGQEELDPIDFMDLAEERLKLGLGSGDSGSHGECRLLGRREETQRDPPDGGARAPARDSG